MAKKLRPSGGYRTLRTFQAATIIYDATVWFCERFIDARSRTVDQMVQAARSGRQNIAEGSRAAATSSQTELRLVNVARASLEELLLDYEDYLRHRRLRQWAADSPESVAVREVPKRFRTEQANRPNRTDPTDPTDWADLSDEARWALYAAWLDHEDGAVRANTLICLINQTNYLLDQQIAALEAQFIGEGGYSEQLATARLAARNGIKTNQTDQTNQTDRADRADRSDLIPACPQCGKSMVLRTARQGKNKGNSFWGCSGYPECKGVATE